MSPRGSFVRRAVALAVVVAMLLPPTASGTFAGVAPAACTNSLSLSPAGNTPATQKLEDAEAGADYSQLITVSGGSGQYFWQLLNGNINYAPLDWNPKGIGGDTLAISGTPTQPGSYSVTFAVQLYPLQTAVCAVAGVYNIKVFKRGKIKITLSTLPLSTQDFTFTGDLGSFILDEDPSAPPPRSRTFPDLKPGKFVVRQGNIQGWKLIQIGCTTGQLYNLDKRKLTIVLQDDGNIECTFVDALLKPDAMIALVDAGPYKGDNRFSATPTPEQTQTRKKVAKGKSYSYFVRVQNDSVLDDMFKLKASVSGSSSITVKELVGGVDKTSAITAGTYKTVNVDANNYMTVEIRVTVPRNAAADAKKTVVLKATSVARPTQIDVVRAITSRGP